MALRGLMMSQGLMIYFFKVSIVKCGIVNYSADGSSLSVSIKLNPSPSSTSSGRTRFEHHRRISSSLQPWKTATQWTIWYNLSHPLVMAILR